MPNRILREGILTSERVNSLGFEAEVFYRRLMSVADDYGRFHAHPALLRAALFPLKLDAVRDEAMARLLEEVETAGLVRTYVVEGKRYLQLLDFRQRVRANASKFPAPPEGMGHPLVGQMTASCGASAGLDVGGGAVEFVVVDESACGGGLPPLLPAADADDGTPPQPDASAAPPVESNFSPAGAAPPVHVQIALHLREAGVNITSAHPLALAWAARGLTVEHALEAVAVARMRKPAGRIAPNYLAPIIEDMLNPSLPARAKAGGPPAWWNSEAATLAKGSALGVNPRPGEAMAEYRARLSEAIARQSQMGANTAPEKIPGPPVGAGA
ncbi:MAG TPA: hypothetical protein VKC56_08470 [Gallionellaceae bacterium]|nr:hypothetical protein [Gallionellaceae bacterium]